MTCKDCLHYGRCISFAQDSRKKNLRRLPPSIVTAQTEYHLYRICAVNGWPERDVGRAIDFVTSEFCKSRRSLDTIPERSFHG